MMKDNYMYTILFCFFLLYGFEGEAQNNLWKKVNFNSVENKTLAVRNSNLIRFEAYKLQSSTFKSVMETAPNRHSTTSNLIIELPIANGELQKFKVFNAPVMAVQLQEDRKSTRLNSSHVAISYAVFCLKKKTHKKKKY